jgi:hypothetical protein
MVMSVAALSDGGAAFRQIAAARIVPQPLVRALRPKRKSREINARF